MGKPFLDTKQVGQILAYAAIYDDVRASRKFGKVPRTIRLYRERMNDPDDKYSQDITAAFLDEYERLSQDWANEIGAAIRDGILFLRTALKSLDPTDPENLRAVNDVVRTLSEIDMARGLVDARLSQFRLTNGETNSQMDAQAYVIESGDIYE